MDISASCSQCKYARQVYDLDVTTYVGCYKLIDSEQPKVTPPISVDQRERSGYVYVNRKVGDTTEYGNRIFMKELVYNTVLPASFACARFEKEKME